jgi:two-component system NarL family sensor kinase
VGGLRRGRDGRCRAVEHRRGVEPVLAFHLFLPTIAVATAVAISKHRLYDIDVLVNRTLVYAVLTAVLTAAYAGIVSLVGVVVEGNAGRGSFVLVAGLVAIFFGPLRQRVQRAVDRLMYGHRDDPYDVISRVGHHLAAPLAPEAVLPDLAEMVAQILRLPYVSIEVRREDNFEIAASHGQPHGQPVAVPLVYQGETVGRLAVSKRAPSEELSATDRRLLEDLARQAGTVVHVLGLSAQLQRSRERLVSAREEERRRLRRDLHDGLGPALAGVALQLENAALLIDQDPRTARALVDRLNGQIQAAVADIRRLVYDLRPPALDELGLIAAIRQQAIQFTTRTGLRGSNALVISVEAPEHIEGLPAAVEVAAYRIVTEAMANAVRHADAMHCTVSIDLDHDLKIGVSDDGRGIRPDAPWGVGLTSMHERAAELGGSSRFETGPTGGTRVRVRLPVGER